MLFILFVNLYCPWVALLSMFQLEDLYLEPSNSSYEIVILFTTLYSIPLCFPPVICYHYQTYEGCFYQKIVKFQ